MPRQWPNCANPKAKNALAAGVAHFRNVFTGRVLEGCPSLIRWNGAFSLFYVGAYSIIEQSLARQICGYL
jgi:hypothetical protein